MVASLDRAPPSDTTSLVALLAAEHRRLEEDWAALGEAWARGRVAVVERLFAGYAGRLRRHMAMEEDVLFPAIEQRVLRESEQEATQVMRAEHRAMRLLLAALEAGLAAGRGLEADVAAELRSLLHDHERKEDMVVEPALERLPAAEADAAAEAARRYTEASA